MRPLKLLASVSNLIAGVAGEFTSVETSEGELYVVLQSSVVQRGFELVRVWVIALIR